MGQYKFKVGDIFKVGTGETAYEVVREEMEGGNLWAVIAGTEHGRFRFNNKHDDLTLIAKAEDPYEYAVQYTYYEGDPDPISESQWNTRESTDRWLKSCVASVKEDTERGIDVPYTFKIVKRRKAGKIEEL